SGFVPPGIDAGRRRANQHAGIGPALADAHQPAGCCLRQPAYRSAAIAAAGAPAVDDRLGGLAGPLRRLVLRRPLAAEMARRPPGRPPGGHVSRAGPLVPESAGESLSLPAIRVARRVPDIPA